MDEKNNKYNIKIKVKYNIGSKPHIIEFNNSKELGDWIIKNYEFNIISIEEGEV